MAGAAALLYWVAHHAEVSFADGLRSVRQAQSIERGDLAGGLWRAIDHPMHPLAIAAAHRLTRGGDDPFAWEAAAQVASALALVLAVIPLYLLALELFGDDTAATLGVVFVVAGPVAVDISVNVLSETTFLLFWTWGLWAALRFLREGRFVWLMPTVGFGALAYLTRPEGLLIHLSLVATLMILPLFRGVHILWPRWWAAVGLLVLGPAALVGPYVAAKGGLGTRPAVARLIGTAPEAPPEALERERPLEPGQTTVQTYAIAVGRVLKAVKGVVRWSLLPPSALGLVLAIRGIGRDRARARAWLFLGAVGLTACFGLVRLHATGGYCTIRHALIPGTLLTLTAAHGLAWLIRSVSFEARWLGLGEGRVRPGPAVWCLAVSVLVGRPLYLRQTPYNDSFAPYQMAGAWLGGHPESDGRVLDLTDWSLYFSGRHGDGFPRVLDASARPEVRYLVARDAHMEGHLHYNEVLRRRVAGRAPVARFPEQPAPRQIQVGVYDLAAPPPADVAGRPSEHPGTRRR
jgi:hypothetical protein